MAPSVAGPVGVDRRHFIRLAAGAAAVTGIVPGSLVPLPARAQERPTGGGPQEGPPPIPLGNGEPPAFAALQLRGLRRTGLASRSIIRVEGHGQTGTTVR